MNHVWRMASDKVDSLLLPCPNAWGRQLWAGVQASHTIGQPTTIYEWCQTFVYLSTAPENTDVCGKKVACG